MSTETRNLAIIEGANVGNPDDNVFTASGISAYANDAAYEVDFPSPAAGAMYFNSTEKLIRQYNGTAWQYDKTIFSTQTDSTTTGSNQDITPSVDQIIRYTHGSLASIRGIIPTTQRFIYLVNDQASQAITIQNQAAGATAANRIVTGNGFDLVLQVGRVIGLAYDEDATRWRVVSGQLPSFALESFADDASYQTAHPGFAQGAAYFNSTSFLCRRYNGTAWQNDKTSYETQTDSTTTGASQDITPNTVSQIIRFTNNSLTSIRSIVPTIQKVIFFVNGQTSQAITIKNEDTGATAANRIVTGTGADFSLSAGQMVALVYETGGTRWRLAGAASSGGSGTDGINLITSPSTATGWTATGTVFATPVTTTTSADLPLEGATNSAIKFVATNSGSEATNYNSFPITTSAAMNGSLQVDLFIRPGTGFAASEWTISVYQGSTRQALRNDSSSVSYLPNGTVRYTTVYDALASTAYTLRFARTSGTGSATLNVCNVFLGWPFVSQVAAVGRMTSYIPTYSAGLGTVSVTNINYQQVVDRVVGEGTFTTGTTTAATATFTLPNNYTANSLINSSNGVVVGRWAANQASATARKGGVILAVGGQSTLYFTSDDYTTAVSPFTSVFGNALFGTGLVVSVNFSVHVNELAGVASTGPAPAEEFLYNSSGITLPGTSNTTSFAYGPEGALIGAINSVTGANNTTQMTVRARYPLQSDDELVVELYNGIGWMPSNMVAPVITQNTTIYGVSMSVINSTDINVVFGNGGYASSAAIYGNAGNAWSGLTSWRWRLRKTKKASLPYQNAGTDVAGLLTYYKTETVAISSSGSAALTGTLRCTRVGNNVTINSETSGGLTHSSSGSFSSAAAVIPAAYRPTQAVSVLFRSTASTVNAVTINTDGSISLLYRDWAGAPTSLTATGENFSISFNINA